MTWRCYTAVESAQGWGWPAPAKNGRLQVFCLSTFCVYFWMYDIFFVCVAIFFLTSDQTAVTFVILASSDPATYCIYKALFKFTDFSLVTFVHLRCHLLTSFHTYTHINDDAFWCNLGFSIFPKDISTCCLQWSGLRQTTILRMMATPPKPQFPQNVVSFGFL